MNIFTIPAIEMLLFALIGYTIAYYLYVRIFKKDFAGVTSADLKVSTMMIILVVGYYYGSGIRIPLFGFTIHWLTYYLVVSGLIEIVFFFIYKKTVGLTWKEIGKTKK